MSDADGIMNVRVDILRILGIPIYTAEGPIVGDRQAHEGVRIGGTNAGQRIVPDSVAHYRHRLAQRADLQADLHLARWSSSGGVRTTVQKNVTTWFAWCIVTFVEH